MRILVFLGCLVMSSGTPLRPDELLRSYAELHPNIDPANPEHGDLLDGDILVKPNEEGDIQIGPLNAMTNKLRRWPEGLLHYQLDDDFTDEEVRRIEAGIADLVENTKVNGQHCVKIEARTTEANYVSVQKYSGCSSYIGRIGGAQRMSLVSGCITRHGTIMHEFLHALGFHHEQKRTDRDDWVIVNYDNIRPGRENNFIKLSSSSIDLLGTDYDYGSVMHYSAYGFAVDPSIPTIVPLDPFAEIGQRLRLSELDIERVQIFYDCLDPIDSKHFKHLA